MKRVLLASVFYCILVLLKDESNEVSLKNTSTYWHVAKYFLNKRIYIIVNRHFGLSHDTCSSTNCIQTSTLVLARYPLFAHSTQGNTHTSYTRIADTETVATSVRADATLPLSPSIDRVPQSDKPEITHLFSHKD